MFAYIFNESVTTPARARKKLKLTRALAHRLPTSHENTLKTLCKRSLAPWTQAFPDQAAQLHPERSKAGGIKARSSSEEVRMAIYRPIAVMFLIINPECQVCRLLVNKSPLPSVEVHHVKGRDGLLLFDTRFWKAICRLCHRTVHDNPKLGKRLGLLQ